MGLILSPEVKLRPDGGRAILFSVNPGDSLMDTAFQFLYPQQAVILSLFDGTRSLLEIERDVAYLFDLDLADASKQVQAVMDLPVNNAQTIGSLILDNCQIDLQNARTYNPQDYIVSADQIDMRDSRCTIPCSLLVLPTMRCATDCVYCYADRAGSRGYPEFGVTLFRRLLGEAKACGIETIQFSGGDFFCRRDAFTLIECVLSEGLYPNIPTKYPLSREQIKRLADTGLTTIQISIDALSPGLIDRLVGRSGYGKRILRTLEDLGRAGIRVRTNSVLTSLNIEDAVDLARHLAQMPHVFKCNFTPYARSMFHHRDALFPLSGQLADFALRFRQVRAEYPHKAMSFSGATPDPYGHGDEKERTSAFWKRAVCTANRRGVVVLPDGRVTICEELYFHDRFIIGDLTEQSLLEIWNSPEAMALAYPDQATVVNGPCKSCPDFRRCHLERGRCVRDALKAYGRDRPHWPDPRCPRAPIGNRMV